jgi:hypothetical protein
VRFEREVWRLARHVSMVGRREVGMELVWWRVAIHAERVVLEFSSFRKRGRKSLQNIPGNLVR